MSNKNKKKLSVLVSMEFTALSRDYEAETKLSTCQRKNCWDHPLLNDTERRIGDVDGVDQNFDDEDEDNNNEKKDISPKKDKAPERKGMTLIDPLANPLADPLGGGGKPLMGGDFDPLGAMGGGVGVQQLAAFAKAKVTRHQARLVLANQATAASTKRKYKSAGEHFFAFLQETGASCLQYIGKPESLASFNLLNL